MNKFTCTSTPLRTYGDEIYPPVPAGKGLESTKFVQQERVLSAGFTVGGLFVVMQLLLKCINLARVLMVGF